MRGLNNFEAFILKLFDSLQNNPIVIAIHLKKKCNFVCAAQKAEDHMQIRIMMVQKPGSLPARAVVSPLTPDPADPPGSSATGPTTKISSTVCNEHTSKFYFFFLFFVLQANFS